MKKVFKNPFKKEININLKHILSINLIDLKAIKVSIKYIVWKSVSFFLYHTPTESL